ncbi:MAG TPA: serine acetyltransferase, partial [Aliiroseovarius sp.]|nr:serine acetyltransferase [Aliiroseovarius sp.]
MEGLALCACERSFGAAVAGKAASVSEIDPDANVSATEPDWSREAVRRFWDPGQKLLRSIRRYQSAKAQGGISGRLAAKGWALSHLFWSVVTQCEIHLNTEIAGGLRLTHPTGIVVHPDAKIGPNCMIFHQVTLAGAVTLGGHVDIGAGAKILGPLTIGAHVRIGANAVVTGDVADGQTVVG